MHNISAVVLTKDEESSMSRCLQSLRWCDEVIVIDDDSIDKTTQIASRHGAKIYSRSLQNDYAEQRNFALTKVKHDWVLFVDADEVVTHKLKKSIQKILVQPRFNSYALRRQNIFLHKKLAFLEHNDTQLVRLVNKKHGMWIRKVHEYWSTETESGKLEGELLHYSVDSINNLFAKIGTYSFIHAIEITKEKKSIHFYKVVVYPPVKFFKKYVFEGGYKDGVRGFIMAVAMSFHSFLSWSQLWLKNR